MLSEIELDGGSENQVEQCKLPAVLAGRETCALVNWQADDEGRRLVKLNQT